jgi:phosphomevalonate kinase
LELTASAPGKLVLLGEYAVLEGAPALSLAVNRRASVRIVSRNDGLCEVNAPDLDVLGAGLSIGIDGDLHWECAAVHAATLRLVDDVWRGLQREGLAPPPGAAFSLDLDTGGFFQTEGPYRVKLGLGSSAALTVALASALTIFAGHGEAIEDRPAWLRRLLRMHGTWQGGRGSGVDIASSLAGGLIAYCLSEERGLSEEQGLSAEQRAPTFEPLDWPLTGVHSLFVWSGQAVSTVDFLRRLALWRESHETEYVAHMRDLGVLSEAAVEALKQANGADFVAIAAAYATALERFGDACGLEIFCAAQRRVAQMATKVGVSYKPCGAGGDFGVIFTQDAGRMARIRQDILAEGLHDVPLSVDRTGFRHDR